MESVATWVPGVGLLGEGDRDVECGGRSRE